MNYKQTQGEPSGKRPDTIVVPQLIPGQAE